MSYPVAILTSDWHGARGAWAKYPGLYGDSYYSIKQIIDYAINNQVDIFAAGDLFDKASPDSASVWYFANELNRLEEYNLKVYFTQGQHEKVRDKPWLNLSSCAIYLHQKQLKFRANNFSCLVYGLDYTRPDILQSEIDKVPEKTDLLLMHQVWRDFMGQYHDCDGSFDMLPPIKTLLTGDFHKSLVRRQINDGNEFIAVSPGSICMQSIDEEPRKSFYVLYDDWGVEQVFIRTRNVHRFVLETEDDLKLFLDDSVKKALIPQEGVPDNIAKNIIDVKYSAEIPDVFSRITKAISDKAFLFPRLIKSTSNKEFIAERKIRQTIVDKGLEGCLSLKCEPNSSVYSIVMRLLKSNNPSQEIENIITDKLAGK